MTQSLRTISVRSIESTSLRRSPSAESRVTSLRIASVVHGMLRSFPSLKTTAESIFPARRQQIAPVSGRSSTGRIGRPTAALIMVDLPALKTPPKLTVTCCSSICRMIPSNVTATSRSSALACLAEPAIWRIKSSTGSGGKFATRGGAIMLNSLCGLLPVHLQHSQLLSQCSYPPERLIHRAQQRVLLRLVALVILGDTFQILLPFFNYGGNRLGDMGRQVIEVLSGLLFQTGTHGLLDFLQVGKHVLQDLLLHSADETEAATHG